MKQVLWVGSSKDVVSKFPGDVKKQIGFALCLAQNGGTSSNSFPLVGFKGSKVLEIIIDNNGDTYRAVYTVKFKDAVYVLHAFKKKSHQGIKTPKHEINLVKMRLKAAEQDYRSRQRERTHGNGKSA